MAIASNEYSDSETTLGQGHRDASSRMREQEDVQSVNLLDDDYEDDKKSVATALQPQEVAATPTPSHAASSPSARSLVSPATQTLNVLSQNMDDLRYDIWNDSAPSTVLESRVVEASLQKRKTNNKKTSKIQDQDRLDWSKLQDEWELIPFAIDEQHGKLGMCIGKAAFCENPHTTSSPAPRHCVVRRLVDDSMAQQHGLQADDWICHPPPPAGDDDQAPILADFESVQLWSKQRPFRAQVLRRKVEKPTANPHKKNDMSTKKAPSPKDHSKAGWLHKNGSPFLPATAKNADDKTKHEPSKDYSTTRAVPKESQRLDFSDDSESISSPSRALLQLASQPFCFRKNPSPTTGQSAVAKKEPPPGSSDATTAKISKPTSSERPSRKRPPVTTIESSSKGGPTKKRKTNDADDKDCSQAPSCLRCHHKTGPKPRKHHAWCRHNEFFEDSGASDLLERIRQGRQLDCHTCDKEYQTGKLLKKEKHRRPCILNQAKLKREREERERKEEEQEEKEKKEKALARRREYRQKQKEQEKKRQVEANDNSSDSATSENDEDEADDEVSLYRPKNRRPIQTISVGKSTLKPTSRHKNHGKESSNKKKAARVTPLPLTKPNSSFTPHNNKNNNKTKNEPLQSNWVSFPSNPWGPVGHVTGDVLLYGPPSGIGHYETVLPSERYTTDPFGSTSGYRNTHATPEQGLAVLSLTRDAMASLSWGFRVGRDEFGHACLVEFVNVMSPAAAATYIGISDPEASAGLSVNDMIVTINGKDVGGMTIVGVELELEICGPRLVLGVSRYRHADGVAKAFAATEREMLAIIDNAAKDNRLIGWLEVGNAKPPPLPAATEKKSDQDDGDAKIGDRAESSRNETAQRDRLALAADADIIDINSDEDSNAGDHVVEDRKLPHERRVVASPEDYPTSAAGLQHAVNSTSSENKDEDEESKDWEEDENAWLGCVCGEIHSGSRSNIFWIQCEACESWFDVSSNCVGFTQVEAGSIEKWTCWACPPPPATASNGDSLQKSDADISDKASAKNADEQEKHRKRSTSPTGEGKRSKSTRDEKQRLEYESRTIDDGCLRPESQPTKREDGSFIRPCPKNPKGMDWDERRGLWVPTASDATQKYSQDSTGPSQCRHPKGTKNDRKRSHGISLTSGSKNSTTTQNITQPTNGEELKRMELESRLTEDGCLRPKWEPKKREDGTFGQPAGHPRSGMHWDAQRGLWVPGDKAESKRKPMKQQRGASDSDKDNVHRNPAYKPSHVTRRSRGSQNQSVSSKPPGSSDSRQDGLDDVLKKGELVFVQAHSWPGVNCQGGVAFIVESYKDDDGDLCYDVKYTIGGGGKEILAKFVTPHEFM